MGAEATSNHDVGLQVPKLGIVAKNSQKFYNKQRDKTMWSGTFKLAFEPHEAREPITKGIKIFNKQSLAAFVTNEYEKNHFTDPDSNMLFTAKSRKTIAKLDNLNLEKNENMANVLKD